MQSSRNRQIQAITLAEVLVALGTMAVALVVMTQAMLILNKNSARARVLNLAKAAVMGSLEEVQIVPYDPNDKTVPVPDLLKLGQTKSNISLGDASTGVGSLPATMTWTVTDAGHNTRQVVCHVDYTYLGRNLSYEALTFRAAD